jgi:hypothetical protein
MPASAGRFGWSLGRRPGRRRPVLGVTVATVTLVLGAVALAGCGLGAGSPPSGVKLTVTQDFGSRVLHTWSAPRVSGQETAMSLLMRNANVTTRYGGGFVQSVDGLSGGGETSGQPVDWFYYVNGVEAPKGAAQTDVNPGDHIWWDRHDWSQTDTVPAVVGSFPEPFLNGIEGKRLPVRIECASESTGPCATVASRLRQLGVPAGIAAIGPAGEPETLRIVVGPWSAVRGDRGAQAIEQGPRASGVYGRFSANGGSLTVLDPQGSEATVLMGSAGLVAATRNDEEAPEWLLIGTDESGVALAARAFDRSTLENRFAVALSSEGAVLSVPEPASASEPASAGPPAPASTGG